MFSENYKMSEKEKSEHSDETIRKLKQNKNEIRIEMMNEIENTNSVRVECLLVTNYVESLLKDIMVVMTVSENSRKIARGTIVEILKDKRLITSEMATDIKKMFTIRDFFGHSMKIEECEKRSEEIIKGMDIPIRLRKRQHNWDKIDLTGKITSIALIILSTLDEVFENISIGID